MKIATLFFKYDYGIKKRGNSIEKNIILPAIKAVYDDVVTFWFEDHGYPDNYDIVQNKIIDFIKDHRPDITFFIFMNNEVANETLLEINKITKTVNWFCDDQWRFEDFSSNKAKYLTHVVTVDKYSVPKYKDIGIKNVILSQWGISKFDEKLENDDIHYMYDLSFVGGKNLTREWFIYELSRKGFSVNCFGFGWNSGKVSESEMNKIFKYSKINLNISNSTPKDIRFYSFLLKKIFFLLFEKASLKYKLKTYLTIFATLLGRKRSKNIEQIKARNFEIPGNFGFQLSQYALEIEDYYNIGKEIAVFSSIDELFLQVEYYLKNDSIRKDITKQGFKRTKNYTYSNRLKDVFERI